MSDNKKRKSLNFYFKNKSYQLMVFKYLFSIVISFLVLKTTHEWSFVLFNLLELAIIFSISNILLKNHKITGQIVNNLLLLLFNIEVLVLLFGNSFVTLIMINNLSSWEALKGRIWIFGLGIILLLIFSFLPSRYVQLSREEKSKLVNNRSFKLLVVLFLGELICLGLVGEKYSPASSLYDLGKAEYQYMQLMKEVKEKSAHAKEKFHKDDITNYVSKPQELPENPNIILIFTEGLSQHIIDDTRGIMPNVSKLQKDSLNFSNYYNHTFATYCGIIGQLYSGYQLKNPDSNYLVSLQSVLANRGYATSFINTEPNNREFSTYLNNLKFGKVVNGTITKGYDVTFDKEAYNDLLNQMSNQSKDRPFFISMYTFGTHIGMDSTAKKFQDGKDRVLNRFYNLDVQIGKFIEKFNQSEFADNTILVFTTDHATYVDDEYKKAFPNFSRSLGNLDKVPLFIYHKGVTPSDINVQGRNSINLTPTILDYLDISSPNYFLGNSLFADKSQMTDFGATFISEVSYYSTNESKVSDFSKEEYEKIKEKVTDYFAASRYP